MFERPTRKKDAFVSRMKTTTSKPIRIFANNCKFVGFDPINNDAGYIIKLAVSKENPCYDLLLNWDKQGLDAAFTNFKEWFPNSDLTDEQLNNYFRPTIANSSIISALVSYVKEPVEVKIGKLETSSFGAYQWNREELKKMRCSIELESQGLYFYPKRFGIRWSVRKIYFHLMNDDIIENIIDPKKEEIEQEWERDIKEIGIEIAKNIVYYEKMIDDYKNMELEMQKYLIEAKKELSMTEKWNQALENVRLQMSIYQRIQN